jgi:tetratricopeptide (TPR) repeat protein
MLKQLPRALLVVLTVVVGAGASCNSVSSENEAQLALYLENAAQYYDGGHYQRAYQQWDQALLLDGSNEKARLGQAMSLYQMGRVDRPEAMEPLSEATRRLEELRGEDFGRDHWKIELGLALVHQRWSDLYERRLRLIEEQERKGVRRDATKFEEAKREFAAHMEEAAHSYEYVLSGSEQEPRHRLTCWIGLAQISAWRGELAKTLEYAELYLEQIERSKSQWRDAIKRYPLDAPIYHSKLTGAEFQEAELRDLMGATLFKLGRTKDAETQLNTVIGLFPDRANPYLNRGVIRQIRGDDDLARADFKKFLVLTSLPEDDPSILEATRRLTEVEMRLAAQEARDSVPLPPQPQPKPR